MNHSGAGVEDNLILRVAEVKDARALLDIYTPYVLTTAITFEYDVPSLNEFEERIRKTLKKYPYIVAELRGEIVGYTYASPFKTRAAYDWSIETSIYVKKDFKRKGIGRALLSKLEEVLSRQNILNVNACIAKPAVEDEYLTNDSVRFHEKMGYRLAGEFNKCGYKFDRWYNMVWMEKHIGEHTSNQTPVINFNPDMME